MIKKALISGLFASICIMQFASLNGMEEEHRMIAGEGSVLVHSRRGSYYDHSNCYAYIDHTTGKISHTKPKSETPNVEAAPVKEVHSIESVSWWALNLPFRAFRYGYETVKTHKKKALLAAVAGYIAYDITTNPESPYAKLFETSKDILYDFLMSFSEVFYPASDATNFYDNEQTPKSLLPTVSEEKIITLKAQIVSRLRQEVHTVTFKGKTLAECIQHYKNYILDLDAKNNIDTVAKNS